MGALTLRRNASPERQAVAVRTPALQLAVSQQHHTHPATPT